MATESMRLNLGCGDVFLPDWRNLDFVARPPHVHRHDLRELLPFDTGTFHVVYHSHVLEHFDPAEAARFLHECFRVMTRGGILRVVVPDLEQKARLYLESLGKADKHPDDDDASNQHEWMTLELLDQMVRRNTGGGLAIFMRSGRCADWVRDRIGDEYEKANSIHPMPPKNQPTGLRQKLQSWMNRLAADRLGLNNADVEEARFRQHGELHRWMYDRVSLAALLKRTGFSNVKIMGASESLIADWRDSGGYLDHGPTGVRRPDSLYIEAVHP